MAEIRKKVVVLCGGRSGEHEVSLVSATSVYQALDKSKYEVRMIGLDKTGRWVSVPQEKIPQQLARARALNLSELTDEVCLLPYPCREPLLDLKTGIREKVDVILPILHGTNAEDGTLQGLLELSQIPFVGSSVLSSAVGMDKDFTKKLCQLEGIPVVPWRVLTKNQNSTLSEMILQLEKEFQYPYFVKPANMGSSVGVSKVKSREEAPLKIQGAWDYDNKLMVEKYIPARELEVSVLGNENPRASVVGEIIPQHEFYSYEAKYLDENGAKLAIPAMDLSPEVAQQLRDLAIKTFLTIECSGLARVDFFLDKVTSEIYLNEINTMPGFTNISMYPKLWQATGLEYPALLDELIRLAIVKHQSKINLKTSFQE